MKYDRTNTSYRDTVLLMWRARWVTPPSFEYTYNMPHNGKVDRSDVSIRESVNYLSGCEQEKLD